MDDVYNGECPKCQSSDVEELTQEIGLDGMSFEMQCLECKHKFCLETITIIVE